MVLLCIYLPKLKKMDECLKKNTRNNFYDHFNNPINEINEDTADNNIVLFYLYVTMAIYP